VSILLVARCDTFVSSRDFCDGGTTTDSDDFLGNRPNASLCIGPRVIWGMSV